MKPLLRIAPLLLVLCACSGKQAKKSAGPSEDGDQTPAQAAQAQPDEAELSFEQRARKHLTELTRRNHKEWGLGDAVRWDADLEEGFITWSFNDKTVRAPVQVIATYDPVAQDLMWGWDHPSVSRELGRHARILREWGRVNKVAPLVTRQIHCSEAEAWTYAAMAALLADAHGVYRGTEEQVYIFFTFDKVIIETPGS